jgi:predicted deacylase
MGVLSYGKTGPEHGARGTMATAKERPSELAREKMECEVITVEVPRQGVVLAQSGEGTVAQL